MRLVTFEKAGVRRVGAVLAGAPGRESWIVDLRAGGRLASRRTGKTNRLASVGDMIELLAAGRPGLAAAKAVLALVDRDIKAAGGKIPATLRGVAHARSRVRLSAPVPRPPKFVCVGLNYRDHAIETNAPVPTVPVLFSKFASSVIGPDDQIVLPRASAEVDYEGEFAIVIGKTGRHVPKVKAFHHVAGYTIVNDVSARDYQKRTSQWLSGKSFDTFGVMGPWIVTADEVPRPHTLPIETWVNGELRQQSSTRQLIFGVRALIADMSRIWTLEPGDVIATGTPGGVGMYRTPPKPLKHGDRVRIEVGRIGVLENGVSRERKRRRR